MPPNPPDSKTPGPGWDRLIRRLPETEEQILERVRGLAASGDVNVAIDRLTDAIDAHPTPALRDQLNELRLRGTRGEPAGGQTDDEPGTDVSDNPFADMEDTVFEAQESPPVSERPDAPPPTDDWSNTAEREPDPVDEAAFASDTSRADGADETDDQIGRSIETADDDFYGEDEKTAFDASTGPSPEPQADPQADSPEGSDVVKLSTSPEDSGIMLDDLLVEGSLDDDEEDVEYDLEEFDTESTHLIDLDSVGASEAETSDQPAGDPPVEEGDSSTIKVDESLRQAVVDADSPDDVPGASARPNRERREDPTNPVARQSEPARQEPSQRAGPNRAGRGPAGSSQRTDGPDAAGPSSPPGDRQPERPEKRPQPRPTPEADEPQEAKLPTAPPSAGNDEADRQRDGSKRKATLAPNEMQAQGSQRDETPAGAVSRLIDRTPLPGWMNSTGVVLVAAVTIASLTVALLFISAVTTSFDARRLAATVSEVESTRQSDTYSGWSNALQKADRRLAGGRGIIRSTLHTFGGIVPGVSPTTLRRRLAARRAFFAAVVEYRFEAYGKQKAEAYAEQTFRGPLSSPMAASSAIYSRLAEGRPGKAVELARQARQKYDTHHILSNAYLAALIDAGETADIARESSKLEQKPDSASVYERYLLGRAARFREDLSAVRLLRRLAQNDQHNHLDAKIAYIEALRDEEQHQKAIDLSREYLRTSVDDVSAFQKARLHNALGRTYRLLGQTARAEEQFRRAIQSYPVRASVYLPLIDLFIADGRLDDARAEVEAAETKARSTARIERRKARIEFLVGQFRTALELLGEPEADTAPRAILRGRILIEQGNYKQARRALNAIGESSPHYRRSKSLELLARARMGVGSRDTIIDEIDGLLEEAGDEPFLLRTAARIRLYYGQFGEERRTDLDAAEELLERSIAEQPDRSLNHYLLCERHLLAGDAERAADSCKKARGHNPDYLPGLLTVARLQLRQGKSTEARTLLDRLVSKFDNRWDVAAMQVRALVQTNDAGQARELLDEWLRRPEADEPEFHLFEGLVAFGRADYRQAVGYLEKARKSDRRRQEASLYLAHTLVRLDEYDRAEDLVRELTATRRWRAPAWLVFGELRRRQGRLRDALENLDLADGHFDDGIAPPWRLSHLYAERAYAWQELRGWDDYRVERALDDGKRRGYSESPEIQLALGLFYLEGPERNVGRAITHLKKVVETQPYRCEGLEALGDAYRMTDEADRRRDVEETQRKYCGG